MINKVMLIGHLGQNVELKTTNNGTSFCNISVATSMTWTKDGEKQQATEWHNVVIWKKNAENCAKYLGKGSKVFIEGRLQTDKYQKDGEDRYYTKIVATNVRFLDSKSDGENKNNFNQKKEEKHNYETDGHKVNTNIDYQADDIPF